MTLQDRLSTSDCKVSYEGRDNKAPGSQPLPAGGDKGSDDAAAGQRRRVACVIELNGTGDITELLNALAAEDLPGKAVIVEGYANFCGHCKKFADVYNELAACMKDQMTFAAIDLAADRSNIIYQIHDTPVSATPTIVLIKYEGKDAHGNPKFSDVVYPNDQPKELHALKEFLTTHVHPNGVECSVDAQLDEEAAAFDEDPEEGGALLSDACAGCAEAAAGLEEDPTAFEFEIDSNISEPIGCAEDLAW
eukprot:tig00000718_g3720.t1